MMDFKLQYVCKSGGAVWSGNATKHSVLTTVAMRGLYTLWVDIAFVDRKGCF